MQDILFKLLQYLSIDNRTYYHEPLFTVEQALQAASLIPGVQCKNLFLKDSKNNLYLVVALHTTNIALKKLSKYIQAPELRFASADLLKEYLGVTPGSVTPFGLICDKDHKIIVLLDEALFSHDLVSFHPFENNASIVIKPYDLIKFIEYCTNACKTIHFNEL